MKSFTNDLESSDWKKTEINTAKNNWQCEIANINYKMWHKPEEQAKTPTWRVIAIRMPTLETLEKTDPEEYERVKYIKEKMARYAKKKILKEYGKVYNDTHWKVINGYSYKFFVTNDFEAAAEDLVVEYNARGSAERKFSFLKKDFSWRLPPFMNMTENTVFIIAAAMANNLYRGLLKYLHKIIPQLRLNMRFGDFKVIFIDVACRAIKGGYIFFSEDIAFEKIV